MTDQYNVPVPEYAHGVQYKSMSEDDLISVSSIFAALGNSTRLRIAELLIQGERTVNEVAQTLGIQQPNASLNLATLQRAGIATVTPRGAQRYYSLRGPRIVHMLMLARQFKELHAGAIRLEVAADESVSGDSIKEAAHAPLPNGADNS